MRRWLVRIFVILVVLVLLAAAGVQAVLWTDLPRQQVVAVLERELGLSVRLDALDVRWSGRTEVHGLRVAPPMGGEAAIDAPRVRVDHTALPWVLLGGSITVHQVTVEDPTLRLRQDAAGQWNVVRMIEAVRGARPVDDAPTPGPIDLPPIDVTGATLRLDVAGRVPVRLEQVTVHGRVGPALDYLLDVDAEPVGTIAVRFARSSPHPHEIEFDLHPPAELLAVFGLEPGGGALGKLEPHEPLAVFNPAARLAPFQPFASLEAPPVIAERAVTTLTAPSEAERDAGVVARGRWRGRMDNGGIAGDVELDRGHVPGVGELAGTLAVEYRQFDQAVIVQPRPRLELTPPLADLGPITLAGGRLTWHDGRLRGRDLRLLGLGGELQIGADLDPAERVGELHAAWRQLTWPAGIRHAGRADLTLQREGAAHRRLDAAIQAGVDTPLGLWRGRANVTATGRDWHDLSGTIATRHTELIRGDQTHEVQDLIADLAVDAPRVLLQRVRFAQPAADQRLTGTGVLDWEQNQWGLTFDTQRLHIPLLHERFAQIAALRFELTGTGAETRLHQARVSAGGVVATANGRYVPSEDQPLRLNVDVREAPIAVGDEQYQWVGADNLLGGLRVTGTLQPLALHAQGELVARSLQLYDERVGDLALAVRADIDGERLRARAAATEWLGGDWLVETLYDYGERPRITVEGEGIDLARVDDLLDGRLALRGSAEHIRLRTVEPPEDHDLTRMIEGSIELRDVVREPIRADRVTAHLELAGDQLRVHGIDARRADGRLTGALTINLNEPTRLELDETLFDWPLREPDDPLQLRVGGVAEGEFDLVQRSGDAAGRLRVRAAQDDHAIMDVTGTWGLEESLLILTWAEGALGDGTLTARGRVHTHDPRRAELSVRWDDVQTEALSHLAPGAAWLEPFRGTLGGTLAFGPTDHRRAVGPIRLQIELHDTGATYRGLPVGPGHVTAYFDPDAERYVLHQARLHAAGGTLNMWGRLSWRSFERYNRRPISGPGRAGAWYTFLQGDLTNIDLEVLTSQLRPDEEPLLGRLTAAATLSTRLDELRADVESVDWRSTFGRGELTLRESDLASVPIFSLLYDIMNVRFLDATPDGEGEARVRVDGGEVVFDRFHYSNRGMNIELAGKISELARGQDAPIDGIAVISVSPLPDIFFLNPVNRALALLLRDVTTVQLRGTLAEPRGRLVPFRGVQRTIGRLLAGAEYEPPETDFEAEEEYEFRLEIDREEAQEAQDAPDAPDEPDEP